MTPTLVTPLPKGPVTRSAIVGVVLATGNVGRQRKRTADISQKYGMARSYNNVSSLSMADTRWSRAHDFYRVAAMKPRYSHEKSVCLSVCPSICLSNAWTVTKRKKLLPHFIPYVRSIIIVFRQKEWLMREDPLYLKFLGKLTSFLWKRRFSIVLCS